MPALLLCRGEYMLEKLGVLLALVVEAQGCELYDLEYLKEGSDRILRLFIDNENGIDLDDCERVSRAVSLVLDESDPISGEYRLQVSSPGVERKLTKPSHYQRFIGSNVSVKLFAPACPVSGRKKFVGTLVAATQDSITIDVQVVGQAKTQPGVLVDKEQHTFNLQQVSACKLQIFD